METATRGHEPEGWELVIALLRAGRAAIETTHARLAAQGHDGTRPAFGYILQLVHAGHDTVTDLGTRLGISSQGVGQIVDDMVERGYLTRTVDPADRRRRRLGLDRRGVDFLDRSAREFDRLRDQWARAIGPDRLSELYADLVALADQHPGTDVLRPLW